MTKDINESINSSSAKYEIVATFTVKGVVEVQDIVGALFGQTEGLLEDLELRELQKSGRVGRIVVNAHSENGITSGEVIIPSSLDKTETAILAATLETVERVGPCSAIFKLENIKDLRKSKLNQIEQRAMELLKGWKSLQEDKDLTEKINAELEKGQIIKWKGLDAGEGIENAEEVIIVEGRNDIQQLLKIGVKNTIAVNGTSIPKTIIELTKKKVCTAFMDGDRGGKMILNELIQVSDIKYYAFAPNKKEVEELHPKEMVKALQQKRPISDYYKEKNQEKNKKYQSLNNRTEKKDSRNHIKSQDRFQKQPYNKNRRDTRNNGRAQRPKGKRGNYKEIIPKQFADKVKTMISSNEAIGLDKNGNEVIRSSNVEFLNQINGNVNTIIIDGVISQRFLDSILEKNIQTIIAVNYSSKLDIKDPNSIKLYYFKDFL